MIANASHPYTLPSRLNNYIGMERFSTKIYDFVDTFVNGPAE
jgi:hypothetical protein